jgi:CRISPR-associated protein Csd1
MILQSLRDYYVRKQGSDPHTIPPIGYEEGAISFVVVLEVDGRFVNIEDWRIGEGRRRRGRPTFVPQGIDRTGKDSWKTAFLLWDHPRYVFGLPRDEEDKNTAVKRLDAFKRRIHHSFPDASIDAGVRAVLQFYAHSKNLESAIRHPLWPEIRDSNGNVTFKLRQATDLVCQTSIVMETVTREFNEKSEIGVGQCLVSGEWGAIAKLHRATPVPGSQATAKLHSYNLDAFNSYGKVKGANAPVSNVAAFEYTTALNVLLASRNLPARKQCLQVGDTWTIFWADKTVELETAVVDIFGEPHNDDPDCNVRAVTSLYKAIENGLLENDEGSVEFFVLGLAPNIARIAIRFWHHSTVAEMAVRIRQHFEDLRIVRREHDYEYLPLKSLLNSIAQTSQKYPKGDPEKVPPNLSGDLMRSILMDLPYPATLLAAALRRIRAEHEVTYARASLIKACINRATRYSNPALKEDLTMSLDEANSNVGYRLGRLFAVLEKIQEEANPGINATIRDRYYGAASSTPVTVFSTLLKLKNHHLSKLDNRGRAVNLEKRIGEIMDGICEFPVQLPLADQGRFAVGYYHQRQNLFKKSDNSTEGAQS